MSRRSRERGFSLVEALIAVVFLATGGLAVYTASMRTLQESAWGAEKIVVEGMLHEMDAALSGLAYCELACLLPRDETSVTDARKAALEKCPALAPASFRPDTDEPGTPAEIEADELWQESAKTRASLKMERFAIFQEVNPGAAVVTCVIRYQSSAGPQIRSERKFLVFQDNEPRPCGSCPEPP